MNILFLADPMSIHDAKWIEFMVTKKAGSIFLLPRRIHSTETKIYGVQSLNPIPNFSIVRFIRTILVVARISSIIKKHKIDLIHILYAEPNALWCLFRNYFKVPMIISSRGTDVLRTIPDTFKKSTGINILVAPAYRKAFQLADWVTGTSKQQLESIAEFSGRISNTSIVRTGVDLRRLLADTSRYFPVGIKTPYILFPRYIKRIYNHEFCLEAIGLLPPLIKEKYTMVFVGKDCGDMEYQKLLEERMKMMNEIGFNFLPKLSQEHIFELYKRSSLVVMTPTTDGSPVSAMEALACGAKVVMGPLEYDNELFNTNVSRLKYWSAQELAELIANTLMKESRLAAPEYLSLIDRNSEMEKMWKVYESVGL